MAGLKNLSDSNRREIADALSEALDTNEMYRKDIDDVVNKMVCCGAPKSILRHFASMRARLEADSERITFLLKGND